MGKRSNVLCELSCWHKLVQLCIICSPFDKHDLSSQSFLGVELDEVSSTVATQRPSLRLSLVDGWHREWDHQSEIIATAGQIDDLSGSQGTDRRYGSMQQKIHRALPPWVLEDSGLFDRHLLYKGRFHENSKHRRLFPGCSG